MTRLIWVKQLLDKLPRVYLVQCQGHLEAVFYLSEHTDENKERGGGEVEGGPTSFNSSPKSLALTVVYVTECDTHALAVLAMTY